ncbi:MAG: CRISPR-associated helicase Cas3' [Kiritimatiellia bacterium]
MQQELYAHSRPDRPIAEWQTLATHAEATAERARAFAGSFNSAPWAELMAHLHDLGKARHSFQSYLRSSNGLTDLDYDTSDRTHSGAGALWAVQALKKLGNLSRVFAYCVAGHHAGLPDWIGGDTPHGALAYRLEYERDVLAEPPVAAWIEAHQAEWMNCPLSAPWRMKTDTSDVSFWIRMLYSCLVDADFLDTEAFMDGDKAEARQGYPKLSALAERFFTQLDAMQQKAPDTPVNRIRAEIRTACEQMAPQAPGLFSLTVPTGGGKTLSGTAFALRHALAHGHQRIIYVIPYTSIIEQTADVLRGFLRTENVVEHHSSLDPNKETQQSRLAAENWDAPIIVTTSVQFFESLYACRSSRCRKLHNIANSVVILDEVQLLPPHLLLPCVEAIRQLTTHYGVSLVLSTATQPALPGLEGVREIIPPELKLYERLKRTELVIQEDLSVRRSWEDLAAELAALPQVLCVVNTRRDCRELYELMPEDTIHLSASMCGKHRTKVITEIKQKLQSGLPVRVVSTQLVEAGVDIDVPVVYRAFSGLASIAQAAGRCNREGRAKGSGRVVVFMPPKPAPLGSLRKQEDAMRDLLAAQVDVEAPDSYPYYFQQLYSRQNDLGSIFKQLLIDGSSVLQFQFREAAQAFQMIDEKASATIIVRYDDNDSLINSLLTVGPKREIMRRIQRYTVNVPRGILMSLIEKGYVEEPFPGLYIQTLPSLYRNDIGLDYDREDISPEDLVI